MQRFLALLSVLLLASTAALCLAQPVYAQAPAITNFSPLAVAPGATTELTVTGTNLDGAKAAWMSLPGQMELSPGEKNGTSKTSVQYRVAMPSDVTAGVAAVRVATDRGVSNVKLLLVDDLPTVAKNGKNKSRATAQAVQPPVAVEGACDAESFDYYQLEVAEGERLSVEVFAARLGSALDPVVRLLDAEGNELAYSDDEPGLGADGRFRYEFAKAGTYTLEIRDIRYTGGASHRYRLRIGDFPLVTNTYPLAVQAGASAQLDFATVDGEGMSPISVSTAEGEVGRHWIGGKQADHKAAASGMAAYLVTSVPEQLEIEPNDSQADATPIDLPGGINGRLQTPGDRDYFRFAARKGERWVFQGQAREYGSPADLFLRMFAADGKRLAEVDDTGVEEGRLDFTVPADGDYTLMVEDLVHRGGPEFVYRVAVQRYQPGFQLALEVDKLDVPQAGVLVAKVTATRAGYDGPIELKVVGAPEGAAVSGSTIAEKQNDTNLRITLPEAAAQGSLHVISVTGHGKLKDEELTATANSLAAWRKATPNLPYPGTEIVESLAVGVGPVFPKFFELTAAKEIAAQPDAKEVSLKVTLKRLEKFEDGVTLSLQGLPQGLTAKAATIEKGKTEASLVIELPKDVAAGEHKLSVLGKATFQNQPQTFTVEDLVLKIATKESPADEAKPKEPVKNEAADKNAESTKQDEPAKAEKK